MRADRPAAQLTRIAGLLRPAIAVQLVMGAVRTIVAQS
jgi:small neutral amino acid transporter SnatA (MarC family)